jgi:Arc/MetJ family transcription regulator
MYWQRGVMRTTIDINEELIKNVMKKAGARTKKDAIVIALKDYLRHKKVEELKGLIGNYESFDLDLDDLKKLRDAR